MKLTRLSLVSTCLLAFASIVYGADILPVWPIPPAPAGTSRATYPVPRVDWLAKFQTNLDKLKGGPYDLVFDGDSITDFWQTTGKPVWTAHYGAIKAADFGISGDQVQHLLWRLQNGELAGQNPKLIVLMIGTNNQGENPQEVADGIKLVLNEYETRCPAAHILLLAVFPRAGDAKAPPRLWVESLNKIISATDYGARVTFLDIGPKFLQPDGTLTKEIMPDALHPSAKGYEIWADAIQSVVDTYFPPSTAPAAK